MAYRCFDDNASGMRSPSVRCLVWSVVYYGNLVLPLILAHMATENGGRIGMGVAIIFYWLLTVLVVYRFYWVGRIFVLGGTVIAFSQLCPVLHYLAGSVALESWDRINGGPGGGAAWSRGLSEIDGFAVTTLTGAILFVAAIACALCLSGVLSGSRDKPRSEITTCRQ